MGADAHELVRKAVEAVVTGDRNLAAEVIAADDVVDEAERATMQQTLMTVMREAPVATDLRFLLSTLEAIGEIEKVADHAVKLARRSRKLAGHFPAELRLPLTQLAELSKAQFAAALRLYSTYESSLAREIIEGDEAVDKLFSVTCRQIYDMIASNPSQAEELVRIMECFHALEHVADHATAIAIHLAMLNERDGRLAK